MTQASPENRRQSLRAPIAVAVKKKVGDRVLLCQASDISTEGIFVASVLDQLDPNDARCLLEFSLPGSTVVIAARGRVVRQAAKGRFHLSAIRFAAIAPSHRRLIQRYVRGPSAVPPPPYLEP
jgi:hypothetical protein